MAEKRHLSFLLFLSFEVGFVKAIQSWSVYVHTHTYSILGIVGMMQSEYVTTGTRSKRN